MSVTVLSFGFLHPWPEKLSRPPEDRIFDLRDKLFDPAHVPDGAMRQLTGLDERVEAFVLQTNGAAELLAGIVRKAAVLAAESPTIAIGCAGGRHRSVVLARHTAQRLNDLGYGAVVRHLHVHRPVVGRTG